MRCAERANGLPRYYQQNFHFQTDGYLSDHSARLYDFQVESLFAGTADVMRRRAYVPIAKIPRRYEERRRPSFWTLARERAGFSRS